jgi:hypothetical protein
MLDSDLLVSESNTGTAPETSFQGFSDTSPGSEPLQSDHQSFRLLLTISALSFLIILAGLNAPSGFLLTCEDQLEYWLAGMSGVSCVSIVCGVVQYYLPKETIGHFCVLALLPVLVSGLEMVSAMLGIVLLHSSQACNQGYWVICLVVLLLSVVKLGCYCVYSMVVILRNCDQCLFSLARLCNINESLQCAYCQEQVDAESCLRYPCRHSFHAYCLGIRLGPSQCPICAPVFDA